MQWLFRPYHRQFQQPLQTQHGAWAVRSGVLLKLEDEERVAFGEITPLDWFGTETLTTALAFCAQWQATRVAGEVDRADSGDGLEAELAAIPDHLPACQFGFGMLLEQWFYPQPERSPESQPKHSIAYLLPTGARAIAHLSQLTPPINDSSPCFKWKIGVATWADELAWFRQVMAALPPGARVRLDANGGLSWDAACAWLAVCADYPAVEFLEQPLAPNSVREMQQLGDRYPTPIALDESVATVRQLEQCLTAGWRGVVVIKAAIAGSPQRLRQVCQRYQPDIVWSSVFETAIARDYLLSRLIPSLTPQPRTLGFGTEHWFADAASSGRSPQALWETL
ncbi:MAG: o-succinylbenzoate synthase [Kaiparowitsia implicata GSE-PSE-MK54-09C]|jgi:O-succinylbenzoate synthase|nr:o-succinylbenzoate synthase [Kaiparowitsia implicata GSE-PSE-MK54-09C]